MYKTVHFITTTYMPWLLSLITIALTVMTGNRHKDTWVFSVLAQFLWLFWIVVTKSWGFLPMNVALTAVAVRNHFKWLDNPVQTVNNTNSPTVKNNVHAKDIHP